VPLGEMSDSRVLAQSQILRLTIACRALASNIRLARADCGPSEFAAADWTSPQDKSGSRRLPAHALDRGEGCSAVSLRSRH
jgi:hypothetical protein